MASSTSAARGDPALAARLGRELEGEVLFDAFNRGRYSTDASIYQTDFTWTLFSISCWKKKR